MAFFVLTLFVSKVFMNSLRLEIIVWCRRHMIGRFILVEMELEECDLCDTA